MNKKSSKKQYNGKKQPTVIKQNKEMSSKTKNILAYILAGFILFWTIASVLGTIGFVRSSAEAETTITRNEVTDDGYVVTFTGLNGAFLTDGQNGVSAVMNDTISMRFERQAEMLTIFAFNNSIALSIDAVSSNQQRALADVVFYELDEYMEYPLYFSFNASSWNAFNGVPYRASYQKGTGDSVVIWVDYADVDGTIVSQLSITISFSAVNWSYLYLPIWTYATDWTAGMYADEIFTYYNYQQNGEYNNGFEAGKNLGYSDGYGQGYLEGTRDSGNYSFMALISAVIDAPIQAFMGLFNFELLGVDMSAFFLSLLTVCTIIAVIKLFM